MTRIECAPIFPVAEAGICAVSCVALTNVVGSICPSNDTAAPETKFEPVTVRVSAPLSWITKAGLTDEIVGRGLAVTVGGIAEKIETVLALGFAATNPARPTAGRVWMNSPETMDPGCAWDAKIREL